MPWLVPRNSIFAVEDLPAELANTFEQGYIWLDLFCIPQNRSELSMTEIARQAKILSTADAVVAWANNILDWTSLRRIIR